jgi:uncharacterized membrane protein
VGEQRISGSDRLSALARTQEAGILCLGLACTACVVAWGLAGSLGLTSGGATVFAVVPTHISGGRALGLSMALKRGFGTWQAIALATLIEGAVVCLFFPVFSLSMKKLIRVHFLDGTLASVRQSASDQQSWVRRWGVVGLIAFVWFPFFMTGPVVGSVIGFLLGLSAWVVVAIVMFGTVMAVISWTFILREVIEWANEVAGEFIPLLVVLVLVVAAATYRLATHRKALADAQRDDRPGESTEDAAADGTTEA